MNSKTRSKAEAYKKAIRQMSEKAKAARLNGDPFPRNDANDPPKGGGSSSSNMVITSRTTGTMRNSSRGLRAFKGNGLKLDSSSIQYLNTVTNPFGTDEKGVDHVVRNAGTRIPAPQALQTYTYTVYRHATLSCAAGYHYIISASKPTTDHGIEIDEIHATTMAAGSPTAYSVLLDGATDNAWYGSSILNKCRIVGMGLKVNTASSDDDTSGTLRATVGDATNMYASLQSTYTSFSNLTDSNDPQEFTCKEGITVRYDPVFSNDSSVNYDTASTAFFSPATLAVGSWTDMPRVEVCGTSATTVLRVDIVMYLECIPTDKSNCPLSNGFGPVSSDWPMVQRLLSMRDMCPLVAHGHSFQDFLNSIGGFFKGIGKGIYNTVTNPKTMETISSIAKLAGPLLGLL